MGRQWTSTDPSDGRENIDAARHVPPLDRLGYPARKQKPGTPVRVPGSALWRRDRPRLPGL